MDAQGALTAEGTLDCLLGCPTQVKPYVLPSMKRGGGHQRKLQAVAASTPDNTPYQQTCSGRGSSSKLQQGTKGVTLPGLGAIICLDYLGEACYIDIQVWKSGRRLTVLPEQLDQSLAGWNQYWKTGGGKMSHGKTRHFMLDVHDCEGRHCPGAECDSELF